jgi:hypothetical protein
MLFNRMFALGSGVALMGNSLFFCQPGAVPGGCRNEDGD